MQEIISYSVTSEPGEARAMLPGSTPEPVRLENPVSADHTAMRRTLRESVLQAVARNLRTWRGPVALFEAGHTFLSFGEGLPEEKVMAAGAFAGLGAELHWLSRETRLDFYDAKGAVESLFADMHIATEFVAAEDPLLVPGRTAEVRLPATGGLRAGVVGEVRAEALKAFDIDIAPVAMFELDLQVIQSAIQTVKPADIYSPIVRYQDAPRDLALVVDREVTAAQVAALAARNRLVTSTTVFDVFEGGDVPQGKKSMAVRITFQSQNKTLTAEEIGKSEEAILRALNKELGATLRN
jgi:phenylalanyl-tRNA synthetase beta chain